MFTTSLNRIPRVHTKYYKSIEDGGDKADVHSKKDKDSRILQEWQAHC